LGGSVVVYDLVDDLESLEKEIPADFCEHVEDNNCSKSDHCPSEDIECEAEVWVVGDELHDWLLEGFGIWFYTIESKNY